MADPQITLKDYQVKAPDGTVVAFKGPANMSDDQVVLRAQQEYAFHAGKIPQTFAQGFTADPGFRSATSAILGGAAAASGSAPLMAVAPMTARAIQQGAEHATGLNPDAPTLGDVAQDAAVGAVAAYGPALISKAARGFAASTVAHQLPNGQWVKGISGSGILPWAVRTGGEATTAVMDSPVGQAVEAATPQAVGRTVGEVTSQAADTAARLRAGVSKEDFQLLMDNINNGMAPSTAAKVVAGKDQSMIGKLMTLYMRSRLK